jgi:phosphate transport system permease protein
MNDTVQNQEAVRLHIKRVKQINSLGKGFLWSTAILTMFVLLLIVGYIVVNGFYTKKVEQQNVASFAEDSIRIPDGEGDYHEISLIVRDSVRLKKLDYDFLRNIFIGENQYWGFITGQDRNIQAGIWASDKGFLSSVQDYLILASPNTGESTLPAAFTPLSSEAALTEFFKKNPGALALVPKELASTVRKAKTLGIQEVSLSINPQVKELNDGVQLRHISEDLLPEILAGEVETWPNIDIPITFIRLSENSPPEQRRAAALVTNLYGESAQGIVVENLDQLERTLEEHPGGAAIVNRRDALLRELSVMDIQYTTHSLNLRPSFLWEAPSRAGEVGGISTIILNTLAVILFVLLIATPLGVAAAIYLVEYAKQGRLLLILRIGTDTLAGIPSIIFGLFGMVFFSQFLKLQTGLLAGSLTLTLMILPTIVRTAEEAFRSVPQHFREGSLALGATKFQTIFRIVLPSALPGILTGVILGMGRAIGETAAVLFTMGSNLALLRSLNSPLRVLSVHLYMLVRETISIPNAFATATILVAIVIIINVTARMLIRKMSHNVEA